MKLISAILCLILFLGCNGSPCSDLSGTWRNQLGSNMTIQKIEGTSKITGRYSTSVESSRGASRFSTKMSGLVKPVEGGSLVAFNVLWNKGASLTAWVGQCIVCDGQPKIHTTWLLRSLQPPRKQWMSTRINQDTFYRVDDIEPPTSESESDHESSGASGLLGEWSSTTGDSFVVTSASESGHGLEGSLPSINNSALFGQHAGNQTYTAFGLVATRPSQIRGWTGHIYNPQEADQILETSWLSQEFSSECNNPRKFVKFGMDNYKK